MEPGGDEVERCPEVDEARDRAVGEGVGADDHEVHVVVDERRQHRADLAGVVAVQRAAHGDGERTEVDPIRV